MRRVVWTDRALNSYVGIVSRIEGDWGLKIALQFEEKVDQILERLLVYPQMYPASLSNPWLRKAVISAQTLLYYKVVEDAIVLLDFWAAARNPDDLGLA